MGQNKPLLSRASHVALRRRTVLLAGVPIVAGALLPFHTDTAMAKTRPTPTPTATATPTPSSGSGSWASTGSMAMAHKNGAAALLGDGQVLIAGDNDVNYFGSVVIPPTAEVYSFRMDGDAAVALPRRRRSSPMGNDS